MSPEITPFIHNCSAIYANIVATNVYVHFSLILAATLGSIVIVMATVLLAASKLATGGKRPTLIYVRSQCVADILVGSFGIIKMSHLLYLLVPERINAFLAESLLICAIMTSNMILTLATFDTLQQLHHHGRHGEWLDKQSVVTVIILLWNGNFVLGFAPQMGWNHRDYSCLFFHYYDYGYLILFLLVFSICLLANTVFHIYLAVYMRQYHKRYTRRRQLRLNLPNIANQITSLRLELVFQILFTAPYMIYIAVQIGGMPKNRPSDYHNVLLIHFAPVLIIRSLASICMHAKRTSAIKHAVYHIWRTKISRTMPCISTSHHQRVVIETPVITRRCSRTPSVESMQGVTQLFSSTSKFSPRIRIPPDVYIIDAIGQRSAISLTGGDSDWSPNNSPSDSSITIYRDNLHLPTNVHHSRLSL